MSPDNVTPTRYWRRRDLRVPHQVRDAFLRGEMSPLQYQILETFYNRVNWITGTFNSLSAEQIIRELRRTGLVPKLKGDTPEQRAKSAKNHIRLIEKQMKTLREHGWYHDDYKESSKRPYTIWLYEHHTRDGGACATTRHERASVETGGDTIKAPSLSADDACDADKQTLTPLVGTHCHPRRGLSDAEESGQSPLLTPSSYVNVNTVSDADGLSSTFGASDGSDDDRIPSFKAVSLPSDSDSSDPLSPSESSSAVRDPSSNDGTRGVKKEPSQAPSQKMHMETDHTDAVQQLRKGIAAISATKLKCVNAIPRRWENKLYCWTIAFPVQTILQDYSNWCDEPHEPFTGIPVIEYSKVIESRLNPQAPTKAEPAAKDPRAERLAAACWELLGVMPPAKSVTRLLAEFSLEDILPALSEFVLTLPDSGHRAGMRQFFVDNGAAVVIDARRRRQAQCALPKPLFPAPQPKPQPKPIMPLVDPKKAAADKLIVEQKAAADAVLAKQRLADDETRHLAQNKNEQIKAAFRAKWDDASLTWDEICAWVKAQNGNFLFSDTKLCDEGYEHHKAVVARSQCQAPTGVQS